MWPDARPPSGCQYISLVHNDTPLSVWRTAPTSPLTSLYWTWVQCNYSWGVKIADRVLEVHLGKERLSVLTSAVCMFVLENPAFELCIWALVTCIGNVSVPADIQYAVSHVRLTQRIGIYQTTRGLNFHTHKPAQYIFLCDMSPGVPLSADELC